jgi:hypothetical protein
VRARRCTNHSVAARRHGGRASLSPRTRGAALGCVHDARPARAGARARCRARRPIGPPTARRSACRSCSVCAPGAWSSASRSGRRLGVCARTARRGTAIRFFRLSRRCCRLRFIRPPSRWSRSCSSAPALVFAAVGVLGRPRVLCRCRPPAVLAASFRSPLVDPRNTAAHRARLTRGVVARRTRAALLPPHPTCSRYLRAKNGSNARYAAELLPLAALGASLGFVAVPRRRLAVVAAGAAVAAVAFAAAPPTPARDSFHTIARELPDSNRPLVTAAADAYGFLLYPRPVRWLRPGARGLVLLDGAARAYEPDAKARGPVVARLYSGNGFLRPDGRIDRLPALLVPPTGSFVPSAGNESPFKGCWTARPPDPRGTVPCKLHQARRLVAVLRRRGLGVRRNDRRRHGLWRRRRQLPTDPIASLSPVTVDFGSLAVGEAGGRSR